MRPASIHKKAHRDGPDRADDTDPEMSQLQATLSARVRGFRLRRGMTGVQLAEAAGISKAMLSLIESGKALPSVPVLAALAKALAVTVGDLFGGSAAASEPQFTPAGAGQRVTLPEGDIEGLSAEALGLITLPGLRVRAAVYHVEGRASKQLPIEFDGFWIDHGLEGKAVIRIGTREFTVAPGDTLVYRAEVPHAIVSATAGCRILSILGEIQAPQDTSHRPTETIRRR